MLILEATVFTFAIEPPTLLTLVILVATVSISLVPSFKSEATVLTLAILLATVLTLAILPETVVTSVALGTNLWNV